MNYNVILRGDVWWVDLDNAFPVMPPNKDHYQRGIRPCVILSNNTNNRHCSTIQVVPLTTQEDDLPQHTYIYVNNIKNYVLPEDIMTVHKTFLRGKYGFINKDMFKRVEQAVNIQLGMYKGVNG
uniref:PemK-like protein n=1 Tax=Siphoviridae sp. ct6GI21 TaxID=2825340 RepID=A0A8S5U434_9CAUD|nr:MAG TPA: PemK-like protein [Caudoviricetes sp.]DAF89220.1 MAG TPA: PemK-like protein [Siphoviridae sp. ct6GI21]